MKKTTTKSKEKIFKIGWKKKGTDKELDYLWTKAKNIKDAKDVAKFHISMKFRESGKSHIAREKFIKSLIFYTY
jgi:hypothetical protein